MNEVQPARRVVLEMIDELIDAFQRLDRLLTTERVSPS